MKNLSLTIALLLLLTANISFSQSLKKGNLVGIHTMKVNLNPDVTMNQYKEFILTKMIPALDKGSPGMKTYLLQGIRGENENSLGFVFMFNSEADRNKYWNEDGTPTELQIAANEKMQAINEEGAKLGTWTSVYTDWVVE